MGQSRDKERQPLTYDYILHIFLHMFVSHFRVHTFTAKINRRSKITAAHRSCCTLIDQQAKSATQKVYNLFNPCKEYCGDKNVEKKTVLCAVGMIILIFLNFLKKNIHFLLLS